MATEKKSETKTKKKTQNIERPDYDSAWKDVIEEQLESFMEFFFPQVHADIDFSKKPEFLDTQLRTIAPGGNAGKRYADELIKVSLKDGSVRFLAIFIHVEVQGSVEKQGVFPERVYVYNYRIFDYNWKKRKGIEVVSLAILTDEDRNYRPDEYKVERWGFQLRMKIPLVKILDYKDNPELREKLETTDNPMAMVVNAQLKSYEVKGGDNERRFAAKLELVRECYRQGYTKKQVTALFRFIDWIIRLPEGLDKEISKEVHRLEEEIKMPYVSSIERFAKKEGIAIGEKRGISIGEKRGISIGEKKGISIGEKKGISIGEKKGISIGKIEALRETARQMLLDGLPIEKIVKYSGLSEEEIQKLSN